MPEFLNTLAAADRGPGYFWLPIIAEVTLLVSVSIFTPIEIVCGTCGYQAGARVGYWRCATGLTTMAGVKSSGARNRLPCEASHTTTQQSSAQVSYHGRLSMC